MGLCGPILVPPPKKHPPKKQRINKENFERFIKKGTRAYADDIMIKFINKQHLIKIINLIEEWATNNKIALNKGKGKSHIMYLN